MPPRRGGRGRGGRARPPSIIRESMQEIGMGSLATYDTIAKMAASANSDAARAYFPPIKESQRTKPTRPVDNERHLLRVTEVVRERMRRSPHYIRVTKLKENAADKELEKLRRYHEGKDTGGDVDEQVQGIWEIEGWMVKEVLPLEVVPLALRGEDRIKKKRKIEENANGNELLGIQEEKIVENVDGDDDAEKDEGEGDVDPQEAQVEVDDDLELDADYQTGHHFDDDEGYEEQDSGAEEATL